jgi:hypothetical protein
MRELTADLHVIATHQLSGGYRNDNLLLDCADGTRSNPTKSRQTPSST